MRQTKMPRAPREGGLSFPEVFTDGRSPMEQVEWDHRDVRVTDWKTGKTIFAHDNFRVPAFWSDNAAQIVASKYAFGPKDDREPGADAVINRVANAITDAGRRMGYFATGTDAKVFRRELKHLCLHQYGSFNSPVWFNVGIYESRGLPGTGRVYRYDAGRDAIVRTHRSYKHPQTSACFIQSVEDNLEDLMRLGTAEAMLFKHGSGSGTDFSKIRSRREYLSTGGRPSGPISFMKVYDRIASVVKSGGKTRRAAKMQTLHVSHPDIVDFVRAKGQEEHKAKLLIAGGMDPDFNGDAYNTVHFQNANFTARVPDQFMGLVVDDPDGGQNWPLLAVTQPRVIEWASAGGLMDAICEETWRCGDPALQFSDTINGWHTCPRDVTGKIPRPINSSNPCSEYLFQDDSACNLASLRLTRFYRDGVFRVDEFRQAVRVFITAQDILVDMGSYPTRKIARNQHDFRTLGLGFADPGALLMKMGLAYDSDAGRRVVGTIAALLTGTAYETSRELADVLGAFEGFEANQDAMRSVLGRHRDNLIALSMADAPTDLVADAIEAAALRAWDAACEGRGSYRNAQVSVIAPTGTIAFMMDCDTTGIEPPLALVVEKTLAGGGSMRVANQSVSDGLVALGYSYEERGRILASIANTGSAEESSKMRGGLDPEHLPVFDCALAPPGSRRAISYHGHLKMMAAVQPFISGAISKTVNVPHDFSPRDIREVYADAWRMGLKCVAIYRDGSKGSQPIKPVGKAPTACINCNAEVLQVAGTCTVCPKCGTPQGGCS